MKKVLLVGMIALMGVAFNVNAEIKSIYPPAVENMCQVAGNVTVTINHRHPQSSNSAVFVDVVNHNNFRVTVVAHVFYRNDSVSAPRHIVVEPNSTLSGQRIEHWGGRASTALNVRHDSFRCESN